MRHIAVTGQKTGSFSISSRASSYAQSCGLSRKDSYTLAKAYLKFTKKGNNSALPVVYSSRVIL